MIMNYRKLKGRIVEKYGTQKAFAKALNISERSLSLKMNSKRDFTGPELIEMVRLLHINPIEFGTYFCTIKEEKSNETT